MTDNSKMHYFQSEKPEPFMGLSSISFVMRSELEEFKQKMDGIYKYVDRDANDINEIRKSLAIMIDRLQIVEEHKNYQIAENKKLSKRVDELEDKQTVEHQKGQMTFINAWLAMTQGEKIRRLEWEALHVYMIHGKIKFSDYNDDENVLSSEDINACDWVTIS